MANTRQKQEERIKNKLEQISYKGYVEKVSIADNNSVVRVWINRDKDFVALNPFVPNFFPDLEKITSKEDLYGGASFLTNTINFGVASNASDEEKKAVPQKLENCIDKLISLRKTTEFKLNKIEETIELEKLYEEMNPLSKLLLQIKINNKIKEIKESETKEPENISVNKSKILPDNIGKKSDNFSDRDYSSSDEEYLYK